MGLMNVPSQQCRVRMGLRKGWEGEDFRAHTPKAFINSHPRTENI